MAEKMEIGIAEAMQSLIKLQSWVAIATYLQLVRCGFMTPAEAAMRIREEAADVEQLPLPAPHIGAAVAKEMRDYADSFDRPARQPQLRPVPHSEE